jgi:hypothetical protein
MAKKESRGSNIKTIVRPDCEAIITEYLEISNRIKADGVKLSQLKEQLQSTGLLCFIQQYEEDKVAPTSIRITSSPDTTENSVLYTVKDSYSKLKAGDADIIKEKLGENFIETEKTYIVGNAAVQEYGDILIDIIARTTRIPQEKKLSILTVSETAKVVDGAINMIADKTDKISAIKLLSPTISIGS